MHVPLREDGNIFAKSMADQRNNITSRPEFSQSKGRRALACWLDSSLFVSFLFIYSFIPRQTHIAITSKPRDSERESMSEKRLCRQLLRRVQIGTWLVLEDLLFGKMSKK